MIKIYKYLYLISKTFKPSYVSSCHLSLFKSFMLVNSQSHTPYNLHFIFLSCTLFFPPTFTDLRIRRSIFSNMRLILHEHISLEIKPTHFNSKYSHEKPYPILKFKTLSVMPFVKLLTKVSLFLFLHLSLKNLFLWMATWNL